MFRERIRNIEKERRDVQKEYKENLIKGLNGDGLRKDQNICDKREIRVVYWEY